jgi:hypothetical protein
MISSAYAINNIVLLTEVYCDVWTEFGRYVFMKLMFQRDDRKIFVLNKGKIQDENV